MLLGSSSVLFKNLLSLEKRKLYSLFSPNVTSPVLGLNSPIILLSLILKLPSLFFSISNEYSVSPSLNAIIFSSMSYEPD